MPVEERSSQHLPCQQSNQSLCFVLVAEALETGNLTLVDRHDPTLRDNEHDPYAAGLSSILLVGLWSSASPVASIFRKFMMTRGRIHGESIIGTVILELRAASWIWRAQRIRG